MRRGIIYIDENYAEFGVFQTSENNIKIDFEGKVACTLFTNGCNFRCPFCHNSPFFLPACSKIFMRTLYREYLQK